MANKLEKWGGQEEPTAGRPLWQRKDLPGSRGLEEKVVREAGRSGGGALECIPSW